MTDFIERLQQGFAAHEETERRKAEISSVIKSLREQVNTATNGQVDIFIRDFKEQRKKTTSLMQLVNPFDLSNVETINVRGLAAGSIPHNHSRMLAKWFDSVSGYPVTIEYDDLSVDAFSKEDLEKALGDLLASPTTGGIIAGLMSSIVKEPLTPSSDGGDDFVDEGKSDS